jgi:hypothetical protein
MHSLIRLAIAALMVASAATTAAAQSQGRSHAPRGPQPAQTAPNIASDPYGERPTSPGAVPCSQRPFALGCDKRGFW